MQIRNRFGWIWTLCALLLAASAFAAEYSPALEAELEKAGPKDFVSAIIILESPIDIRALDWKLHDQKADLATRHREVIDALKYNAEATQPAFKVDLEDAQANGKLTGFTAYWIENLFVVHARKDFIESLRWRGDVRFVTENFRAELIAPEIQEMKPGYDFRRERDRNPLDNLFVPPGIVATEAYRVCTELGITGAGVLVANCDTGVDGTHPALSARWRGNHAPAAECWRDAAGFGDATPADHHSHGTHVMGTITGRGIVGADTQWVGSAPDAEWIATNSINQGVSPDFDNDIIADYQWFADPDGNNGTLDDVPDVIQNSWGVFTGLGYAQCFDFWNTVILNCEAAGPVITWSAGNESTSGLRSPAIYSINAYQIYAVASVNATDFAPPYPLSSFSSQGPTPCAPAVPDNIKPEIAAPGENVYSSVPGGGYQGGWSGTSMAGPHVAGVVALMRQACPNCDHITIKDAINANAIDYGTAGDDNQYGHGFIQAYNAVLAVSNLGRINGVVTASGSGTPIVGARVKNAGGNEQTLTTGGGNYSLPLQDGTYTIEYSSFGYITQNIPGIVVTEGDTVFRNVALVAAPTGTVSGIVTDCFGSPAVGATVTVLNTPVPPATTNGSGFYSITLPQGTYNMSAFGTGCGTATANGVVVGASTTQNFTLPTDPIYSCTPADGGGYVACENGDAGGCPFSWIEISPLAGGPGTNTGLSFDDQSLNIALPFTFRFYGTDYTSVNVNSNGTLNFDFGFASYFNGPFPMGGAGACIAPYWDDLYLPSGGSDVSYYYYAAQNAFIIEWYNIQHYPGTDPRETFQVWLHNIATNPGPNGQSQFRMQYLTISSGTSTVGIQNSAESVYTQYEADGATHPNAQGLANSRVITWGGCTALPTGTIAGTITNCGGGAAPFAQVSFPGSFYPPITANGTGQYSLSVVAGTYDVRADLLPCTYARSNGHVVTNGNTTTVNLTLRAPTQIQGTITNCTGGPAAGATVSFPGSLIPDQTTNGAGFYSVVLDAGTYDVRAANGTCTAVQQNGNVVAEATTLTVNLTLMAPGTIQGTVTSCFGGPAVGATVTLSGGPVTPPPQNTNGAGFYSFGTLPAANYDVTVVFGGCAPGFAGAVTVTSGGTTTQNFTLVTDPRAVCSADDPYGYHFCEDADAGGIPFNWRAISPMEGGPGTNLNIVCDDCFSGPYNFPFAVQFYGQNYTQYYVGSNGYITMGTGAVTLGGCFPADFLPPGIFAYWSDLYTVPANAQVASYYDAVNHWLVIEWYNVSHCCSQGNYETFEIIIYDEAFRPTRFNDNDILIQYSDSLTHYFNSDAVGIKAATGPNYSRYDCQGTLDPTAFGLAEGRTILFTTGPGCDFGPPDIAVNPTSVTGTAPLGGTDTETLQICNTGPCPLRWSINWDQTTPAASTGIGSPFAVVEQDKAYLDILDAVRNGEKPVPEMENRGRDQLDAQGGPDAFGYRWIDSDEPGGPVYSWVEINAIGINTGLSGDDQTMSVTLPWTFELYGIGYTSMNISSNGNVHFGTANAAYWNDGQALPNPNGPLAMVAAFWDDLYLPTFGEVYYYNDVVNNRFIIEWDDIAHIGSTTDHYTFQIILYPNGRILYQYEDLIPGTYGLTTCSIGLQDQAAAVGLSVVFDAAYLHSNMAIQLQATPDWLTVSPPVSGELAAGACVNLTLNFDAGDLPTGVYTGNLVITSDDPDENPTNVPVTFNVGELEPPLNLTIYRTLLPNELKFRWISTGAPFYKLLSSTVYGGPYTTVEALVTTDNVTLPGTPANSRKFYVVIATDTP